MRLRRLILAVVMGAVAALGMSSVSAADDLPRTFAGCVANGGDVRPVDDEVTCRLVRAYDFRVYGTTTTECGEEIALEIWGETRTGVVTFFLAPGKTTELPEIGMEGAWEDASATTIPCQDGEYGSGG